MKKSRKLQAADRQLLKDLRTKYPDLANALFDKYNAERDHLFKTVSDTTIRDISLQRLRTDTLHRAEREHQSREQKKLLMSLPIETVAELRATPMRAMRSINSAIGPAPTIVTTFYVPRGTPLESIFP